VRGGDGRDRGLGEDPAGRRLLFVAGLHRSGTTMLARELAGHPQVSGFAGTGVPADDGQHLQSVYPIVSKGRQAGRFAFLPEAHLTERSPLATPASARRLFADWSRYWDLDRPVLLEKSPPNILMTRFLQALFPSASFILVVRHPIAVAAATQKWSATRPHQLLRHWDRAHRLALGDLPHLRRALIIRYEDLVADPDAELGRAFAFTGLVEHSPGRRVHAGVNADNFVSDRVVRADVNDKYFASWEGRRRNAAMRAYLSLLARVYDRSARRFGYSTREPRRPPLPRPEVALLAGAAAGAPSRAGAAAGPG
jgi:hypothetical protein